MKDVKHSVQQPRSFWLEAWWWDQGMISRNKSQGYFILVRALLKVSVVILLHRVDIWDHAPVDLQSPLVSAQGQPSE